MGCDMFDAAKAIALAGLRPGEGDSVRAALFLRFYGSDFDVRTRERILDRLQESGATSGLGASRVDEGGCQSG